MISTRGNTTTDSVRLNQLRDFGEVMCLALTVLGGLALFNGHAWAMLFFLFALFFLAGALFWPRYLERPENYWMAFAERLSAVVTVILVTFFFYLVLTPFGLMLRALGKDLLELAPESRSLSYWCAIEPDGPGSRHYRPF